MDFGLFGEKILQIGLFSLEIKNIFDIS